MFSWSGRLLIEKIAGRASGLRALASRLCSF